MERFERGPAGLLEMSLEGRISYANETLALWLDRDAKDLVGLNIDSILDVANRVFLHTHFLPLLRLHGRAEEIFLTLISNQQKKLPVVTCAATSANGFQCAFLPVPQRRGYEDEILRARKSAEDALTNNEALQKAKLQAESYAFGLEQKLQEINRRNEEFVRVSQILSHELREPVRKIILFTDLARGHVENLADPEAVEAIRKIDAESAQMGELINATRTFLQVDTSSATEELELTDLVRKAAEAVSMKLGFSDWLFDCERLPKISGRRTALTLLFSQLLENAIKFRSPDRRLKVSVSGRIIQRNIFAHTKDRYTYRDFVQVEVVDNGRGFDPKYKDYVFGLLRKVDLKSSGLGIGLALCRKVAESHYGSIDVEPEKNLGCRFVLLLPVSQETPTTG